ncbi:hypothetical protein J437_LFUL006228 [Ladona fulva]|uniref:CRC domain-containing protein n=1 Tax=Ladona fulva TaxID=123851 RepID=A0A8K0NZW4_LADFU|nr:hypothetical protein J437_LFUL006228 [Ladona fulva]
MVEVPVSPTKMQPSAVSQGITFTRVNSSITSSPTKITVIPATMRNAPLHIFQAPNQGVVTPTSQISAHSGQQRVYTIQTSNSMDSNVTPVMTAVSSTGQLLQCIPQNIVKAIPKFQVQGKQVQYVQLINPTKTVTPVATQVSSSSTQLASCPTLQMVVIPSSKQEVQVKKPFNMSKIKSTEEVIVHKEEPKVSKPVTLPPEALLPRKPCNCTKSQCLKLYCECFANGEFCNQCKCVNCFNNLEHEEDRQKAIKACLDRNRDAFRPKIGKGLIGDGRRHNRGCQCKRSGCLKNYCECYEAKISCTDICKCVGCRNFSSAYRDVKELGPESEDMKNRQDLPRMYRDSIEPRSGKTQHQGLVQVKKPKELMTPTVIEAACQCMIAQVVDIKRHNNNVPNSVLERNVLKEFGKCLVQIVESSRNFNEGIANGKDDSFT